MQIALTKKLADAMEVKLPAVYEMTNPLFTWTANWTTVWDNRRAEDMLVLVNNATRFTVAVYQVKRRDLKNVAEKMTTAISNTLLYMNINPEIVSEYMRLAGEVEFVKNMNRQATSWVNKAGQECAFNVGRHHNGVTKMYSDTVGASSNYRIVNKSGDRNEGYYPYIEMREALTELTGKQTYKGRAFELMVSLDLQVYKAERRLIVPAGMRLDDFHTLLQYVFGWRGYHLYDFKIRDEKTKEELVRLVLNKADLEYDEGAVLIQNHTLEEFFPKYKQMIYRYDFGDNWEHSIQLCRVIEEHDGELPYLLEASGQTPPEDVGGVSGFINFRDIMLNPKHPEYSEIKEWARYWIPELREWERKPKVIHIW